MYVTDTIAAIATPPGEGGIAIVRISGPDALSIADRIFKGHGLPPSQRPSHVILHGHIVAEGRTLDEVLLLIMRGPHSYTREDVVEIHCHGGMLVAQQILSAVLSAGARAAEPGEFTKRAFLNGRLDLVQAEAVLDLIHAKTERAAIAALEQLSGRISDSLSSIYESLVSICSDLEATLDFGDEELPENILSGIEDRIDKVLGHLLELYETRREGQLLREGFTVTITGKPNVGKSTLFNYLVGKPRAIVSRHPGTTRDTIEEWISIEGFPVKLIDTAGIREASCEVEIEGIRRAKEAASRSHIRIHMLDNSTALDAEDQKHLQELNPSNSLIIINKSDLECKLQLDKLPPGFHTVKVSLLTREGLENLRASLVGLIHRASKGAVHTAAISERHAKNLLKAIGHLKEAKKILLSSGFDGSDIAAHELRSASEQVAEILGRRYTDDLLDSIFSKFCIGK